MLPPPMTHSWSGGVPAVALPHGRQTGDGLRPLPGKVRAVGDDDVPPLGQGPPAGKGVQRPAAQDDRAPQGEGAKALHVRRQGEEQIIVPADGPVLIDDDDGIHSAGLLK